MKNIDDIFEHETIVSPAELDQPLFEDKKKKGADPKMKNKAYAIEKKDEQKALHKEGFKK